MAVGEGFGGVGLVLVGEDLEECEVGEPGVPVPELSGVDGAGGDEGVGEGPGGVVLHAGVVVGGGGLDEGGGVGLGGWGAEAGEE